MSTMKPPVLPLSVVESVAVSTTLIVRPVCVAVGFGNGIAQLHLPAAQVAVQNRLVDVLIVAATLWPVAQLPLTVPGLFATLNVLAALGTLASRVGLAVFTDRLTVAELAVPPLASG